MAFSWVPYYKELAQKLIQYRDKRKELLDIIYLIRNTTITDESQLTRQYDDVFYIEDKDKLNKLLDKTSIIASVS